MGSDDGTENVDQKGSLFIVDPNPPGRDMIPPEDMFIYVKFTATPRSRFIYAGLNSSGEVDRIENGVEDQVDFISTKIKYTPDGKLDPSTQKTYATTSWTNIGGLGPTESRGVLEGFGIKSIDIKYNASLVPVVDITFTDIRGAGLFDTIKDKERLSPYSVFFKMPYPVFNLSVKGYFGQSVDYCLHMVNWTSNFDGGTGNFDITANFLGFQQAFLNDMNIGNIIGTVNTQRGFNNLNQIFDEQDANEQQQIGVDGTLSNSANFSQIENKQGTNVRKIDDFFTKIAKLQIDAEVIKSETTDLDRLKQINGQLSLLKSIRSFIGSPIPKTSDSNNDDIIDDEEKQFGKGPDTYLFKYNNKNTIITSKINDNILQKGENYLSIRDYLLINSTQQTSFKIYMETLHTIIKQYIDYSKLLENTEDNTSPSAAVDNQNKDMIDSFIPTSSPTKYWENFVVSKDDNSNVEPLKLPLVLDRMSTKGNTLNLSNTYKESAQETNKFFNMDSFSAKTSAGAFYKENSGLTNKTNVLVVDFREIRERVQGVIEELTIVAKDEREKVQKILNKQITENFQNELGFKPTVDNCFRIIANNTQAMTSTIYDITKASTDQGLKEFRRDALEQYQTDVPTDITDPIAWPLVYSENDSGALEEIYIGDEAYNIDISSFPEVEFVEEVFTNLIAKTKSLEQTSRASVLKNGLDTDNWFPINPIDYKINPWISFSTKNDDIKMDSFIAENLFNRVAVLKNYSKWSKSENVRSNEKFASLDGIAANKSFITPDIRNIYKNKLEKINNGLPNSIMDTTFGKQLKLIGSDFVYNSDSPTTISGINIGGTKQKDVDYILFDVKGIISNSQRLPSEILQNSRYTAIKGDYSKSDGDFYSEEYKNNNINTKIAYNVWDDKVSEELDGKNNLNYGGKFKINSLSSIDLTGTTAPDNLGSFLNRTNFTSVPNCASDYPQFLIQSEFYEKQSTFSKALLLLSTLPFKTFKEAVLDVAFPDGYKNAKIINLPEYYIYFIGGYLWRNESVEDPIDWLGTIDDNSLFCSYILKSSTKQSYLTKVGYLATIVDRDDDIPLEPELLNIPLNTKKLFINKFKKWASSSKFDSFEFDMKTYRSDTAVVASNISASAADIKQQLSKTTNMIILAPGIFDITDGIPENLTVSQTDIQKYIESFLTTYKNLENGRSETEQDNSESEVSSNKTTNKIKLQIYNYFKNINDKWVSDTEKSFNVCGGSGGNLSLYDYFKFIDRGWNDIGNQATINLSSFLTLGSNLQTSVYFFMSKLLRDSNFLFQILPTYVDFTDASEISKMFKPVTTIKNNVSSGPVYCCIYVGGASQALDIGEKSTYAFANDGFSLDNPPSDMSNDGGNSLVAFRVGFGAENQTIFKNVSLSQQEHKETGEYFKALSELVDKRGGTQKVYQGTDLLKLFKTRSYTCKVDALGCMNIQPLMYFNLENVPFFNGAYLITSVNHNISPNHMTTNFQGVRQSKYISPPNEEILADLNIDLNETNEIPKIVFDNLKTTDPLWKIGVLNPQEPFNFDSNWNVDNFEEMGVDFNYVAGVSDSTKSQIQTKLDTVRDYMELEKIITNSQVCMFVANVMTQSTYLSSNKTSWSAEDTSIERAVFDNSTIYSGGNVTRYYGVNPPPVDNPFYSELAGQTDTTILGSTPTFSSSTVNGDGSTNIAYKSINKIKYEEDNTYNVNKKRIKDANENEDLSADQKQKVIDVANSNISGLTYYNIYPGDGWRFKPRGYLYITGRREYFEYSNNWGGAYGSNLALNEPDFIEKDIVDSFQAAVYNWKFKKPTSKETLKGPYKNSYDAAGGDGTDKKRKGTSSDYVLTNEISCEGVTIKDAFNAFESVLLAFNLKDDDNP